MPPGGPERQNTRFGPRPPPSANSPATDNNAKPSLFTKSIGISALKISVSKAPTTPTSSFSLRSFVESLGLPLNRQSELLVILARFFSLPLQETLLKQAQTSARAQAGPWESALLAILSAASKGLRLREDTLQSYIRAIDPSLRERKAGSSGNQTGQVGEPISGQDRPVESVGEEAFSRGNKGFSGSFGGSGSSEGSDQGAGGNTQGRSDDNTGKEPPGDGESDRSVGRGKEERGIGADPKAVEDVLAEKSETFLSGSGALAFLNRLRLSSGKKWLVLPFSFSLQNIDFELTVRLLCNGNSRENAVERMTMDLFFPGPGNERTKAHRWIFVLVNPTTENSKLIVTRDPPFSDNEKGVYTRLLGTIVQPYAKGVFFGDRLQTEGSVDDPVTLFTPVEEHV